MSSQASAQAQPKVVNGVDVSALMDTIAAVKQNPQIATFHFRGKNTWMGGDHNRSTFKDFYGALQEHRGESEPFVIDNGEPPVLLGQDQGANPAEHLLNALMGCMTTTMVYHAASRGIEIKAVDTESEGDIDLRGFLGLSDTIRKGYQNIRVRMRVKSDAKPETLRELAKFSPIYDVVSNSVPVDVTIETY
jgi:uncharacterized OsmC-like protein